MQSGEGEEEEITEGNRFLSSHLSHILLSFSKHLISTDCVPGSVLGAREIIMGETQWVPPRGCSGLPHMDRSGGVSKQQPQ